MNNQTETTSNQSVAGEAAAECGACSPAHLQCGPKLGVFAALLAALLGWGIWQAIGPVFVMPERLTDLPTPVPADLAAEQDQATAMVNRCNATLAITILAAIVGLFVTTAEAYSRRVLRSSCWKAPIAAVLAASLGAGAGLAGSFVLESPQLLGGWSPLAKTIMVQATTLGVLGLGVGIGVAVSTGKLRAIMHSATSGMLGGLLAALIYPACVAYLLPVVQTERVMPKDTLSRLIWMTMAGVLIGLVLTGMGKRAVRDRERTD